MRKAIICDIDGVLTDNSIYSGLDRDFYRFNKKDGYGVDILRQKGYDVFFITLEKNYYIFQKRAAKLNVPFHSARSIEGKETIIKNTASNYDKAIYITDGYYDMSIIQNLKNVGIEIIPTRDCDPALSEYRHTCNGGEGVLFEVSQWLS